MCGPPLNGRPFFVGMPNPWCRRLLNLNLLPRCLVAFFPYLRTVVLYFNTCFQVTSATTGVLKRNRVQITGCRATVCCSEWSQPHMLHNKATVSATRYGKAMTQYNKPGYLPENGDECFREKKQQSGAVKSPHFVTVSL